MYKNKTKVHIKLSSTYGTYCSAFNVYCVLIVFSLLTMVNQATMWQLCLTTMSLLCTFCILAYTFIVGSLRYCMQSTNILFLNMLASIQYGVQTSVA